MGNMRTRSLLQKAKTINLSLKKSDVFKSLVESIRLYCVCVLLSASFMSVSLILNLFMFFFYCVLFFMDLFSPLYPSVTSGIIASEFKCSHFIQY